MENMIENEIDYSAIVDNLYIYLLNPNIEPNLQGCYENMFDDPQFVNRASYGIDGNNSFIELITLDGETIKLTIEVSK